MFAILLQRKISWITNNYYSYRKKERTLYPAFPKERFLTPRAERSGARGVKNHSEGKAGYSEFFFSVAKMVFCHFTTFTKNVWHSLIINVILSKFKFSGKVLLLIVLQKEEQYV